MQCPNCRRENETTSHFCIFCGAPLPAPEAEQPSEAAGGPIDTFPQQLQTLQNEVRHLRELVALMNDRLAALERMQEIAVPPPEPTPAPPFEPTTVPPTVVPPSPEAAPRPAAKVKEWEQILGGNWLARIGVLALIIGAGFFLKFAFDQNWLGPTGRVILGIVAGLAMLGGGHYWRKRYPTFAQAMSGGGIALLYLSIFAAFVMFNLIGFYLAVGLLLLLSGASAGLALRYNSMALAIIGIIGAFIAPFILAVSATGVPGATGTVQAGQSFWLLVYIMVVDLGVLWLSTFRNWRWFTLLALIGSLAVFGVWYDRFGSEVSLLTSQGSLTLIFLIFVGATTLYHIVWRRAAQAFDYALMVINAVSYLGISFGLMWADLRVWMGGFSLLLALFYGGLAYVALRRGAENVRLGFFALGIALLFFTVAIPVQLGDKAWTTITWAAEGTVLMWLSFRLRMPQFRISSYAVFAAVAVRLLLFDFMLDLRTFTPVLNERFLAFLVSIAAMYLTGYLLWRERKSLWAQEESAWCVYPIFLVAANFFSVWLLSAELWGYFSSQLATLGGEDIARASALQNIRNLSLTALWAVYAVILLVIGIVRRSRPVRLAALALLFVPIAKVFVYDVFSLEQVYRIVAFVGLGVLLLVSGYLYHRYSEAIRGFIVEK